MKPPLSRFTTRRLGWLTSGLLLTSLLAGPPATADTAQQRLLRQLHLGEARQDSSLVEQALSRLTSIAPNAPRVLEARIRQAFDRQDIASVDALIEQLARQTPTDQDTLARMRSLRHLATPAGKKALGQARLFAAAGRLNQARQAFDALYPAGPPTLVLALEYWRLMARLPDGNAPAIEALQRLDKRYPESPGLNFTLARLLLANDQPDAAYQRLAWLASQTGTRDEAAKQWRASLRDVPPSPATVKAWQAFLRVFDESQYAQDARTTLARHRQRLADPAYQARRRGLAAVDAGSASDATARDLQRALNATPEDPELLGALAVLRMRQGRHAQALPLLQRAQRLDKSGLDDERWRSLIATADYWRHISKGDSALEAKDFPVARAAYRQATRLDPTTPHAWRGLGDTALAEDQFEAAERAYRQALKRAPLDTLSLERLARLYARDSIDRALAFIDGLGRPQRQLLLETRRELLLTQLKAQGDELRSQNRHELAQHYYRQALELAPEDIWLNYRLAQSLQYQGLSGQGRALMTELVARLDAARDATPAQRAQARYAQALLLAAEDRDSQALAVLEAIPPSGRDPDVLALMTRLRRQGALNDAATLYAQGRQAEARRLLEAQPPHAATALQLGDWAPPADALKHYRRAVALAEHDPSALANAQLRLAEALHAQGEARQARQLLEKLVLPPEASDLQREAASQWAQLGETTRARQLLDPLLASPQASEDVLLQREAARLAYQEGRPDRALDHYRQGLIAAGLAPEAIRDDDAALTRALRSSVSRMAALRIAAPGTAALQEPRATSNTPAWLANSLRSETAELYRARNTKLSLDSRLQSDDGTPGVSELTTHIQMFQVDTPWPFGEGRGFLQLDAVKLDAGDWELDDSNRTLATFGTCAELGCQDPARQRQEGVSLGLGWYNDRWRFDIGTTPLGFETQDWTAGLRHDGDWSPLWTRTTLSRRPLTSSLLAYAGTRDPRTGTTWGGVSASGLSLGLGYDRGGDNGFWSSLDLHQLEGENVEDNQRVQLMGGVYRRLINQPDRRLTLGLSSIAMHYAKDLSGYSLGQGGYYSPQQYLSLGVPLSYQRRLEDWNWELEASLSHSWTDSDDQRRYPLGGQAVAGLPDANVSSTGETGGGLGFSATGRLERRLTDHWQAGLEVAIREAEDDSPRSLQFYLRYRLAPWQGDLALSSSPLTPYNALD